MVIMVSFGQIYAEGMPSARNNQSRFEMKWRLVLWPLAVVYDFLTKVRNHLFDIGHKPSFRFEIPVVSVGNLSTGGSGKTPMIEYLIRLLSPTHHIATLSRGYGRKTRGLRFAGNDDDASSIGDEPFQLFRKFSPDVKVVVGEDRAFAIPNLLNEFPDVDLVLLDDAFQHRSVRPSFSILLTEYEHLFTKDFVLPAGNLREARSGASRADVVVVTKCPSQVDDEVQLVDSIRKYVGPKPVFLSIINYGQPVSFGLPSELGSRVVLLTGIANPDPLVKYLSQSNTIEHHFRYGDHHRYRRSEVDEMIAFATKRQAPIVTTEKDMARLLGGGCSDAVQEYPFFFVPIQAGFLKNGSEFDELVRRNLTVE
jgi:tetraacyldisaccharide 4'-kinase